MTNIFGGNPWDAKPNNQEKLTGEAVSEFNKELSADGVELENIEDDNASRERGVITAAATVLVLKFADKAGPKIFKKVIDKLTLLMEAKKIDINKNIKIFGHETSYSVGDLISKWKDICKFIWPKADWNSVNDTELGEKSISIINTVIGQMNTLALSKEQLDSLGGKITSILVSARSKNANAIDNVTLNEKDISDINLAINNVDKLSLESKQKDEQKSTIALAKLNEIIGRKIKTTLS